MRVLLVDHDPDFAEVMVLLLENEGHQVRVADSILRDVISFRPDATIVDFHLPIQRGFALGKRIREHTTGGLIALSPWPLPTAEEDGACFDRILMKPVDFRSLREVLIACSSNAS